MTAEMPPAVAAALSPAAVPQVPAVVPLPTWMASMAIIAHLKSWVRAEIELRLHGVGLRDRERFNP